MGKCCWMARQLFPHTSPLNISEVWLLPNFIFLQRAHCKQDSYMWSRDRYICLPKYLDMTTFSGLTVYVYGFCLGRTEGGRGRGMDRLTLNILTLILPTCPEQNVWTVLRKLVVRQTLTLTRDHLLNSPYCTTITGYKLTGEVCLWSAVGA